MFAGILQSFHNIHFSLSSGRWKALEEVRREALCAAPRRKGRPSYQDVAFQKKTRFDGDADAGLAVALDVTETEKHKTSNNKPAFIILFCCEK